MSDRHRQIWRIGNILTIVAAAMLVSAVVALAQAPDIVTLTLPVAVKIVLTQPKPVRAVPTPGAIAQTGAASDALKKLIAEHCCLADVMYFEARGEGETGMRAVAEVILHRLTEGSHGHTICSVVYEGAGPAFCQFTLACDGSFDHPKSPEDWRTAQVLAARLPAGEGPGPDNTEGATYFHAIAVQPSWAPKMERLTQIGNHIFYRTKAAAISVAFCGPLR